MAAENTNENQEQEVKKLDLVVDVQETGSCERHVKIEVSRADVDRYFDKEFGDIQLTQAIPGFRAGKAPRKLIVKRFRKEVQDRVKFALLSDAVAQVNDSEALTPISEPDINFAAVKLPEEGAFIFEYNVEVRPKFDVPNWKGLKLEKPVRDFTDKDVDEAIERIRSQAAQLVAKDAPAELGDYIVTKLVFTLDGEVLSQANSETIRIRPVLSFRDCKIADFDKLMTGAKPGDVVKTSVKLADDHPEERLRGKTVEATFEIAEVKTAELPEVDEDFLYAAGGFENVGDFRDAVLDQLKAQFEHEQRKSYRAQIVAALTKGANWDLPPKLLKAQSARELARARYELLTAGFSEEQIQSNLNFLTQNTNAATAHALKEHFVFESIAENEGLKVEEEEVEEEIARIAAQSNESYRRVLNMINRTGQSDVIYNQVVERKVIELILKEAEYVEKPYVDPSEIAESAIDRGVAPSGEDTIPEVSEEEAKEVARKAAEGK